MKMWMKGAIAVLILNFLYNTYFLAVYGIDTLFDPHYMFWNYVLFMAIPSIIWGGILGFILGKAEAWKKDKQKVIFKTIFYLAIIVIYYLTIETIYNYGLGQYLQKIPILSFFIIVILAYFSRNPFDGMMIGLTLLAPWLIWFLFSAHSPLHNQLGFTAGIGFWFLVLFTMLGTIVGAISGLIGSRRRKDKSREGEL
jgi:hypothetical protein